jgi:hypothetical protein
MNDIGGLLSLLILLAIVGLIVSWICIPFILMEISKGIKTTNRFLEVMKEDIEAVVYEKHI